jgi:hypothetical protein
MAEGLPRTHLRCVGFFEKKHSLETLPPDGIPGGRASLGELGFAGSRELQSKLQV